MKDFALKLEGCSKADRKKVIKLAKSVGKEWGDKDRFKTRDDWKTFCVCDNTIEYTGSTYSRDFISTYQMPRDWNKIQEVLGIEVPKDGEIAKIITGYNESIIVRFKKYPIIGNNNECYSILNKHDKFNMCGFGFWKNSKIEKAKPEEEAKLIEAEHDNGYHWDGKELVKIPEYVEIIDNKDKHKTWEKYHIGSVCEVAYAHPNGGYGVGLTINNPKGGSGYLFNGDFKPSTKEAFEAQEAKKEFEKQMKDVSLITENSELKQTINTLSSTADILAQENVELIRDNKYWKDRNEKQETLYNNTLVVNRKIVRDKELLQRKIREVSSVSCNM